MGIQDSRLGFSGSRSMDSGLSVLDSSLCQWNLDSGFQSLVGFCIPRAVFRILQTIISQIPESGFLCMERLFVIFVYWWSIETINEAISLRFLIVFSVSSLPQDVTDPLECDGNLADDNYEEAEDDDENEEKAASNSDDVDVEESDKNLVKHSERYKFITVSSRIQQWWQLTHAMAVFIVRTHYPSARTWANICSSSGYASLV